MDLNAKLLLYLVDKIGTIGGISYSRGGKGKYLADCFSINQVLKVPKGMQGSCFGFGSNLIVCDASLTQFYSDFFLVNGLKFFSMQFHQQQVKRVGPHIDHCSLFGICHCHFFLDGRIYKVF